MSVEDERNVNTEHYWKQTITGKIEVPGENPVTTQNLMPYITNVYGRDKMPPSRLQTAK